MCAWADCKFAFDSFETQQMVKGSGNEADEIGSILKRNFCFFLCTKENRKFKFRLSS